MEKLRSWSDGDGNIAAAMRMYHANAAIPRDQLLRRVEVPSGFAIFAGDMMRPPRSWLERTANVVRAIEPARGGHFAPFEQPELYVHELREFFRPYARLSPPDSDRWRCTLRSRRLSA